MRLFFSSKADANHPLIQACNSLGFEFIADSLLQFEAIEQSPSKPYEVVFFSSPRAYTFGKSFIQRDTKIACVSSGTAKYIEHPVDWTGKTPQNPIQTAQDFRAWVGERRVLFPVSDRSLGSISNAFPKAQIECLDVYKTILSPKVIPPCDAYIFTSPSNAEAFLQCNALPAGVIVFSWGKSTQAFLQERKIESTCILEESTDWTATLTRWINR